MTRGCRESGASLVELAIGLAIFVVLFGSLIQFERTSTGLTSTTLVTGRVEEAIGRATMAVGGELRWARPDTLLITPESGSDRADFVTAIGSSGGNVVWSTPISIRYEPEAGDGNGNGAADEGSLVRVQDGVRRVLCRNVAFGGLTITRTGDRVQVSLTVFGPAGDGQLVQTNGQYSTVLMNREAP